MNDHPEIEDLQNYLNNSSGAEFNGLRLHLAQCLQCRTLVEGLTNLNDISKQQTDSLTEDQHQKIDDYLQNRLNVDDHKKQKAFIYSNPHAMKAALHYASRQSAQNRQAMNQTAPASTQQSTGSNLWSRITSSLAALFSYQSPAWITAPTAAAVVALLSFNLYQQSSEEPNYNIASYQDNAIIQFRSRNSLPGIGFFAKSENTTVDFSGVDITVSENKNFIIHWPAIAKAVKYNLRLQVFDQGNKKLIGSITTDKNSALITTELTNIFHRYEWVLTGETSENLSFMANGGFVINNLEKGSLR